MEVTVHKEVDPYVVASETAAGAAVTVTAIDTTVILITKDQHESTPPTSPSTPPQTIAPLLTDRTLQERNDSISEIHDYHAKGNVVIDSHGQFRSNLSDQLNFDTHYGSREPSGYICVDPAPLFNSDCTWESITSSCNANIHPPKLVDTLSELIITTQHLNLQTYISFDCENNSNKSYLGRICAIQISTSSQDYLIDTLALWDHIHEHLGPIFADRRITKIAHSVGGCDVPGLYKDFGIFIRRCFDTQVAFNFISNGVNGAGLIALVTKFGLSQSVQFGELKKQMHMTDWTIRPFTQKMIEYATSDSRVLIPIYHILIHELLKISAEDKSHLICTLPESSSVVLQGNTASTTPVNRMCCSSMLSSFDHTNRSHQYNIDDPNEDIPNHIHETCLKKMYNKIIEFYYDVMDDIYLSFGDILEDEDELNGPELLQSELNLEVAQLQPSSLITIVFAESNKICRKLWSPTSRMRLGFSTPRDGSSQLPQLQYKVETDQVVVTSMPGVSMETKEHLCVWREQTAVAYDLPSNAVCKNLLIMELSLKLPLDLTQLYKICSPLPYFLAAKVVYFLDDGTVLGAELLLASIIEGVTLFKEAERCIRVPNVM